jgi:hypothetical protein
MEMSEDWLKCRITPRLGFRDVAAVSNPSIWLGVVLSALRSINLWFFSIRHSGSFPGMPWNWLRVVVRHVWTARRRSTCLNRFRVIEPMWNAFICFVTSTPNRSTEPTFRGAASSPRCFRSRRHLVPTRAARGRYLALRLMTEWAFQTILAKAGLSRMAVVWGTMARGLALVPEGSVEDLRVVRSDVEATLKRISPFLDIILRTSPVTRQDFLSGRLPEVFEHAFGDVPDGNSKADRPDAHGRIDAAYSAAIAELATRVDAGRLVLPADQDAGRVPLFHGLEGWLCWAQEEGLSESARARAIALTKAVKLHAMVPASSHFCPSLSGLPGLSVLRGDLRGYKKSMYALSSLAEMLSMSNRTQWALADRVVQAIRSVQHDGSAGITLLHVLGDDVVVHGPKEAIWALARALERSCANLGNGFVAAVADVAQGATSHEIGVATARMARIRRGELAQ